MNPLCGQEQSRFPSGVGAWIAAVALWVLLCCPAFAPGQDSEGSGRASLEATVDRASARFGERVVLTLAYALPEGAHLPEKLQIAGLEGLAVVRQEKEPGLIRTELLVDQLETWKTTAIALTYLDKEGKPQTVEAGAVSVQVLSNLGDKPEEAQLRPIQGLLPTKPLWLRYWPWAAALVVVLLSVAGFLWWRQRRRIEALQAEVFEPAHVRARKDLERLAGAGLFEKGHVKAFYFQFSEILRRYLGAIRDFPAVELTTEEIASRTNREEDRVIITLLRTADLIKFADGLSSPAKKDDEMRTALDYIEQTRPTALPPDGSPAAGRQPG